MTSTNAVSALSTKELEEDLAWTGRKIEQASGEVARVRAHIDKHGSSPEADEMLVAAVARNTVAETEHTNAVLRSTTAANSSARQACPRSRF